MKQFYCRCGRPVFFDSESCLGCGAALGFDPARMAMLALEASGDGWQDGEGRRFRRCANGTEFAVCNWLVPEQQAHPLCRGCQFNRTVPNQANPANRLRWQRLEEGKKRLLYTLWQLGLPLANGWDDPERGLLLDFVEDERSDTALPETFVTTGYLSGVITVNVLEADDAAREAQRLQMNERYRTVLGHLRHESGHYFWQWLAPESDLLSEFRALFGDEREDYGAALARYYAEPPRNDWNTAYISRYASAHPSEDWAESWGHYLHIHDALETAAAHGLSGRWPDQMPVAERVAAWAELAVTLNELNRSVGLKDAYPFVLNDTVARKLEFVERVISRLRTAGSAMAAG